MPLANVMNADSMATKGNPKMRNDAFTIFADARKISKDELVGKGKELADMVGTDIRRCSIVMMVLDAINKGLPQHEGIAQDVSGNRGDTKGYQ